VALAAMKINTWPSFAFTLGQGFTTWPEQADEFSPTERITNRSLNHPMQSGFASWFHESVGGIRPGAPGFKRIELKPHGYTQLAWAKAEHNSLYGPIRSNWRFENGKFNWQVSIPANTTAIIYVPVKEGGPVTEGGQPVGLRPGVKFLSNENGRAIYEIESGDFNFQSPL